MVACTNNSNQKINATVADDYIIPDTAKANNNTHLIVTKHALVAFKQSACKSNTQAPDKILHKELRADTLVIKVRSTQMCDAAYKGDFNFADNHLNLSLTQLPQIIKRKNGQTDTIYTTTECYCVYEFTYTISNTHAVPQTIILNGKTVN